MAIVAADRQVIFIIIFTIPLIFFGTVIWLIATRFTSHRLVTMWIFAPSLLVSFFILDNVSGNRVVPYFNPNETVATVVLVTLGMLAAYSISLLLLVVGDFVSTRFSQHPSKTSVPILIQTAIPVALFISGLGYIYTQSPSLYHTLGLFTFVFAAFAVVVIGIVVNRLQSSSQFSVQSDHQYQPVLASGSAPPFDHSSQPQTPNPVQSFSDSGPPEGMALRLKRSERQGTFGKMIFALDARMEVSAEIRSLIQKYRLGSHIIYESAKREAYAEAAKAHAENSRDNTSVFAPASQQMVGVGKTFWNLGRAAVSATVSALSLRITVDSLIKGHHIECKDMDELLDAENQIKLAAVNLKSYLADTTTFTGQEDIFVP